MDDEMRVVTCVYVSVRASCCIFIVPAQLLVVLGARPLRPALNRHQVTQAYPPSQQGHSRLGATLTRRCAHGPASTVYLLSDSQ